MALPVTRVGAMADRPSPQGRPERHAEAFVKTFKRDYARVPPSFSRL